MTTTTSNQKWPQKAAFCLPQRMRNIYQILTRKVPLAWLLKKLKTFHQTVVKKRFHLTLLMRMVFNYLKSKQHPTCSGAPLLSHSRLLICLTHIWCRMYSHLSEREARGNLVLCFRKRTRNTLRFFLIINRLEGVRILYTSSVSAYN